MLNLPFATIVPSTTFNNKIYSALQQIRILYRPFRLGGKTNASTGNLIRHMKADHSDIYSTNDAGADEKFVCRFKCLTKNH